MHQALSLGGRALVDAVVRLAFEKKADEAVVIDLRKTTAPADWFVVCQAGNTSHSRAISHHIHGSLRREGVYPSHVEGEEQGRWIVIDYFDVVAHIMLNEARRYYALERLWSGEKESLAPEEPPAWQRGQWPARQPKRLTNFTYPRRG